MNISDTLFVFKNDNEHHGSIGVAAKNIAEAMNEVTTKWFANYFDFDFSVTIVNSTSGLVNMEGK